jgi:hypothetical protein
MITLTTTMTTMTLPWQRLVLLFWVMARARAVLVGGGAEVTKVAVEAVAEVVGEWRWPFEGALPLRQSAGFL